MTPTKPRTRSRTRNTTKTTIPKRQPDYSATPQRQKRSFSPDASTFTNNDSKKNKSSKSPKTKTKAMEFEELKHLITSSTAKIENKIQSTQVTLEGKFNDFAENVKEEVSAIKSSVIEFHNKINDELCEVKVQLSTYAERMDNTDDDIQRLQRNQDLRLVGFAAKENENLNDIFISIAKKIGFDIGTNTTMPSVERLKNYNKATKQIIPSPNILIHFAILRQKQQFYALYLKNMPLDPTTFGLTAENRIVIGENLTLKNAQIFKQAHIYKKSKSIAQAFTEDGIVEIKFAKGKTEPTHTVRSITALETIVMKQEHATVPVPHAQSSNSTDNGNTNEKENGTNNSAPAKPAPPNNNNLNMNVISNGGPTASAINTSKSVTAINNNNNGSSSAPMEIGNGL